MLIGDVVAGQALAILAGGILHAAIGVVDEAAGLRLAGSRAFQRQWQ